MKRCSSNENLQTIYVFIIININIGNVFDVFDVTVGRNSREEDPRDKWSISLSPHRTGLLVVAEANICVMCHQHLPTIKLHVLLLSISSLWVHGQEGRELMSHILFSTQLNCIKSTFFRCWLTMTIMMGWDAATCRRPRASTGGAQWAKMEPTFAARLLYLNWIL